MKNRILTVLILLSSTILFAQEKAETLSTTKTTNIENTIDVSLSKTKTIGGLYLFINSVPYSKYITIGETKISWNNPTDYNDQISILVFNAKSDYKNVQGLIIDTSTKRFTAKVIVFGELSNN